MEGEDRQQQGPQQPGLRCPRCRSMETKFCYFNNFKKSQPRHFCKTCGRHWTHGGTLRNIPVGGGVKMGRRSRAPSSSTSSGGGTGEIVRVAISSPQPPPLAVGSGAGVHNLNFSGGGFTLATQILSRPQPPASLPLQLRFTPVNHLSLLQGFSNSLNPFISNPVGQGQGQSRRHPVGQLHQVPISPNGVTGLWVPPVISTTPASANAATKYPSVTPNAAIYWDQNVSTAGGKSGGSSSIDWSGQLPGYSPFL